VCSSDLPSLEVDLEARGGVPTLLFPWPQPAAAAVFRRGGYLWVLFDQPARFNFDKLASNDRQPFGPPQQVAVERGSALRMTLVPGINPLVLRSDSTWRLEMRPRDARSEVPLEIDVQPVSPQGPRVFIVAEEFGEPITLNDPEVGDELKVVPMGLIGRGVDPEREYAEFTLLATEQGVAVRPRADGVMVMLQNDGIAIAMQRGLFVTLGAPSSGETGAPGAAPQRRQPRPSRPGALFEADTWRRGDDAQFLRTKQNLQQRISDATSVSRSPPRLELARFLWAHGLSAEAVGLLSMIEAEDADLGSRADVKALRGAGRFMMRRFDEAQEDFTGAAFIGNAEAALWRGAIQAAQGRWTAASEFFARASEIPDSYPRNYKAELAVLGAQAAIKVKNYRGAGQYVDVIANSDPTEADRARMNYVRGLIFLGTGDYERAVELWRELIVGSDRWSRVRSEQALLDADVERRKVSRTEAIDRLERLRFAWRGDDVEFETLARLGRLYNEERDYRNGLSMLKLAVTLYPQHEEAKQLTDEMANAFSRLFVDGEADKLEPVAALALFDDFRELTPPGEKGNQIINRLVDRLVDIDLLDRASVLLERQIKFRLQGVEKARAGARLALIRLIDRKPAVAATAIDESAVTEALPEPLQRERLLLRARADFENGKPDEALQRLDVDKSRDADMLRAEILWRLQRWPEAADVFQRLVDSTDMGRGPISDDKSRLILNLAVSLSLSNNLTKLAEVRRRYGPVMDRGPLRDAFRLVANRVPGQVTDFSTLVARVKEIDEFQSFLANYRERLKQGQLSAVN
jgi:tetratricopeptide (TPR) repeat protein